MIYEAFTIVVLAASAQALLVGRIADVVTRQAKGREAAGERIA